MKKGISLLDMHKYSKKAFYHLLGKLRDDKFQRPYIYHEKAINAVTGILWDITQENEELKDIIQEMDKIDGIKALNSKSSNEKRVETWLKKAYYEHIYGSFSISRNHLLAFMITIIPSRMAKRPKSKVRRPLNRSILNGTIFILFPPDYTCILPYYEKIRRQKYIPKSLLPL